MAKHISVVAEDTSASATSSWLQSMQAKTAFSFPSQIGEDLYSALYDYVQCEPTEDGDTFELDGVEVGRRESVHFIPTNPNPTHEE